MRAISIEVKPKSCLGWGLNSKLDRFSIAIVVHFYPTLLCTGEAGTLIDDSFSGLYSKGKLIALPANIIPGWECLRVTKAIAYYGTEIITVVSNFTV